MAVDIALRWASAAASSEGDLDERFVNVSGTPIFSCVKRDLGSEYNGQLIADVYTLTFGGSGTTCYVSAALGDKNPWHNPTTGVSITADSATEHTNVIPGLVIVFSSGTGDTNSAKVTIGAYMTSGGVVTDALNFGIVANNGELESFRAAAKNVGDRDAANVFVRRLPGLYYYGDIAETHIVRIGPHSDSARDQLATANSHTITFSGWTLVGSYYTSNVYVDGTLCIASAIFDGETVYEYGSGNGYSDANDKLRGLQIIFADTDVSPVSDSVTLVVAGGWSWVQLAPDIGGTAGSFQPTELELGEVASGDTVYFWIGWAVPEGTARGAIKLWTPRIACMEV